MVGPRARWLAAPGRHDRQSSPLGVPDVPDPASDRPQPGSLNRPRGACAGGVNPDGRGRPGRGRAGRPLGRGERRAASLSRRATGDVAGLGRFASAVRQSEGTVRILRETADLDGDGIGDARIVDLGATGAVEGQPTGSRTAIIRSGRDGRVLWKSRLGAQERWYERDAGEHYSMESFPMPAGDLDGDGTPDLVVRRYRYSGRPSRRGRNRPRWTSSGRTGRPLGSAGPLHLGFDARGERMSSGSRRRSIEPQARPDILVRHVNSFSRAVTSHARPTSARAA